MWTGSSPNATTITEVSGRTRHSAWLMVGCLFVFYVYSFLDRTTIAMLVDPIRADLHITDTQMSLLVGFAFAMAYSIGGLPWSWLVDRFPRRLILFLGVTLWALATAACGTAGTFTQLFLARFAVGLGEAPVHPASHSMISDAFPPRDLAKAISVYSLGSVIGAGLALVAGGWIVNQMLMLGPVDLPLIGAAQPWQMVFVCLGLPGIPLGLLIFFFPEPARRGLAMSAGARSASWRDLFVFVRKRARLLTCFTIAFGGMQIINGAFIWWQPVYLSRYFGLSPAKYGLGLGLITAIAGVTGMLFSGWIVDWLYRRGHKDAHMRYYFWAIVVSTPFTLVALLTTHVWLYFGLIWITKLLLLNALGFSSALIQLISPNEIRGRMSAIFVNLVLAFSASALGPLVPALISDDLLRDQVRLGRALAVAIAIFVPLALIALQVGRQSLVQAVEEAEAWQ